MKRSVKRGDYQLRRTSSSPLPFPPPTLQPSHSLWETFVRRNVNLLVFFFFFPENLVGAEKVLPLRASISLSKQIPARYVGPSSRRRSRSRPHDRAFLWAGEGAHLQQGSVLVPVGPRRLVDCASGSVSVNQSPNECRQGIHVISKMA